MLVLLRSSKPLCALGLLLAAGCSGSGKSSTPPPTAPSVTAQLPPVTTVRGGPTETPSAVRIGSSTSPGAGDAGTRGRRVLINEAETLLLTDPDGANRRKIAENVSAAAFSPDGNLVAYADKQGVYVLSLLDGLSVSLAKVTEGQVDNLAWSPDQKHLAFYMATSPQNWNLLLASYPPVGDAPRNLGHWYESISFSPNGKFIVHPSFDATGAAGPPAFLETVNVETGKRESIYRGATTIWEAKYAPDGSSIAFIMAKMAPVRQIADDDEPECGGPQTDLWILPLESKTPVKIMDRAFDFEWSPDGRWLAIEQGTDDCTSPPGDAAVLISSPDGKQQFQISKNAPSIRARFSPDSKRVMFVEFDASRFVIGDLKTRELTTLADDDRRTGIYDLWICDWK